MEKVEKRFSNKFRKLLFEKINKLSGTEHEEILKIIKLHDTNYTQNKNGIFFNISAVEDEIIEEINNFVSYSLINSLELDEYDKKLNECKLNQKIDTMVGWENSTFTKNVVFDNNINSVKVRHDDEWACLSSIEEKKMINISHFVEKMNLDSDKIGKKKVNIKFYNAQKKYSKKSASDKKIGDVCEDMRQEPYIII